MAEQRIQVCQVNDLQNGEMREVDVGDLGKVLLIKDKDKFSAVSTKCTHYNAPLKNGAYLNGQVRCQWHGACFNTTTGDIEDYPGGDSLSTYKVDVSGSSVYVTASAESLKVKKRGKATCKHDAGDKRTFVVVGGGPAALTCAQTLRENGFKGKLLMFSKEEHLPYDRPKLSKAMTVTPEKITLRPQEFFDKNDIEISLGSAVTEVDPEAKTVTVGGKKISYDACTIATGGRAQPLAFIKGASLGNIFTLRKISDAHSIIGAVEGKNVAIVGSSFIGMEVAACIAKLAAKVTVIGMEKVPFERVLGSKVGEALQNIHVEKGIEFKMGAIVQEFKETDGKVSSLVLKSGEELPCDLAVIGAGIICNTDLVTSDKIEKARDRSFIVDADLKLADGLYCAGDIARYPLKMLDGHQVRIEHWGMAQFHGKIAGLNMLGGNKKVDNVPFFWTSQFGKNIRYCGHALDYDDVLIDSEDNLKPEKPTALKFVAYYVKGEKVLAVASLGRDPIVSHAANRLLAGTHPTTTEIKAAIAKGSTDSLFKAN